MLTSLDGRAKSRNISLRSSITGFMISEESDKKKEKFRSKRKR